MPKQVNSDFCMRRLAGSEVNSRNKTIFQHIDGNKLILGICLV